MRYPNFDSEQAGRQDARAAIFIDYENLYALLTERTAAMKPDECINEMLDELRRYLLEEHRTQTALVLAYADFSGLRGNGQFIQRSLYLQGAEPRFVPASMQRNASEIQLTVDAMDVLQNRADVRTFVVLTGDRAYLPLVQHFKRLGAKAFVVALDAPAGSDRRSFAEDDFFVDVKKLVSEATRRQLSAPPRREVRNGSGAPPSAPPVRRARPQPRLPYGELSRPVARRTLEIIEEYFGQYEEVYLTPLLRKMSELLDDDLYDPKTIISELEEIGAVHLEKRRGFPYDYTVLIVDSEHPNVKEIQERFYTREPERGYRRDVQERDDEYTYDDYAEDEYSEDDDYAEDIEDSYDDDFVEDDYEPDDEEEFDEDEPAPAAALTEAEDDDYFEDDEEAEHAS